MNDISDDLVEAANKMLPAYSARSIRAALEAIAPDLLAQIHERGPSSGYALVYSVHSVRGDSHPRCIYFGWRNLRAANRAN